MGEANDLVEAAEARIGKTLLGKWRIVRLVGVGGMAAVYEAEHRNRSHVAVKILHSRAGFSNAQRLRFQREGYVANRVGHPGVVEIYDDDVCEDGSAFLVMELLTGQTVADRAMASGGALSCEEVLDIGERLLDVLAAAHAKGILHRDVKPENLFLTVEDQLKVLDFGIARLADSELGWSRTADGTLLGTPAFSPPEQARGRLDEMDERSDVWAAGATLFTLLTGRYVHEGATPNEQLGLAMTATPPSLGSVMPTIPDAVVRLVDRALAYERAERWPSARAMQEEIRRLRESTDEVVVPAHPVHASPTPSGAPVTFDAEPPAPRAPGGKGHAVAVAVTVAVLPLTALLFWEHSRPADTNAKTVKSVALVSAPDKRAPGSAEPPPIPVPLAARLIPPTPGPGAVARGTTGRVFQRARAKEDVSAVQSLNAAIQNAATAGPAPSSNPFDRRH